MINRQCRRLFPLLRFVLSGVLLLTLLAVAGSVLAETGATDQAKKPAYPEVWGVELPTDDVGRARDALIFQDAKDRILISYWYETGSEQVYRIHDFFGQTTVKEWRLPRQGPAEDRAAAQARMEEERKRFEEAPGVKVLVTEREKLPFLGPEDNRLYVYDDGSLLKGAGGLNLTYGRKTGFVPCNFRLGGFGRRWRGRAPAEISYPELNNGVLLLRLYKEAQPMDAEELCECTGKMAEFWLHNSQQEITASSHLAGCNDVDVARWNLHYRVRSFQTIASAVLGDGTFLVNDRGYPTVVRFRPYLESPYLVTRDDLFVVARMEMVKLAEKAVKQYRTEANKKDLDDGFDEYTAEDLVGIFRKLDPLVGSYLIKKRKR